MQNIHNWVDLSKKTIKMGIKIQNQIRFFTAINTNNVENITTKRYEKNIKWVIKKNDFS